MALLTLYFSLIQSSSFFIPPIFDCCLCVTSRLPSQPPFHLFDGLDSLFLSLFSLSLFLFHRRGLLGWPPIKKPSVEQPKTISVNFQKEIMHRFSLRRTAARNEATDEAPRPQAESESPLSSSMPDAELGSNDPGAGITPTHASRSYRDAAASNEKSCAPRPSREGAVQIKSAPPNEALATRCRS